MTNISLPARTERRPSALPRGLVLIGLALGAWVVLAVVVVLVLRGLGLL